MTHVRPDLTLTAVNFLGRGYEAQRFPVEGGSVVYRVRLYEEDSDAEFLYVTRSSREAKAHIKEWMIVSSKL